MTSVYIHAALRLAQYDLLPDDKLYYGEIPGFDGACASAENLADCREELESVLEDWLLISIRKDLPVPVIDNVSPDVKDFD